MNKIMYKNFLIVMMIFSLFTGIIFDKYVIANTNEIYVSGPQTVEEGGTITFNVSFGSNAQNIWLSDGDIIKKGFNGNVSVKKISDKNYSVIISNVSNVGNYKFIMINSGVCYIDGAPNKSIGSNIFAITEKSNNNITDKPNNNTNNNTPNKPSNNTNNNTPNKPSDNNTNNNEQNKPTNNTNNNEQNKPSNNTNNNTPNIPSNNTNNNTPNKPSNNNTNNIINKPTNNNTNNNINNQNTNEVDTKIEEEKIENEVKEEKVLREIPNTGKFF